MDGDRPIEHLSRVSFWKMAVYVAMRLLPYARVRCWVASMLAFAVRRSRPRGEAAYTKGALSPQLADHLQELHQQGLTRFGQLISTAQVAEMRNFLSTRELVAPDGRRFFEAQPPVGVQIASFPVRTVLECPHVIELMNSPTMLQLAGAYLGCTPTISGLRIDWSHPSEGAPADVQRFHRDYDDWRFLKLFIYLTDVDDSSGPHEYVLTSHRGSGRLHARPYEQQELEATYGKDRLLRVVGPAGSSFIVDTWGVHKGNIPRTGARIMLQIQYSIAPVLRFDYQPVKLATPAPVNAFVNRLLIA